jgi:hypothetical protein
MLLFFYRRAHGVQVQCARRRCTRGCTPAHSVWAVCPPATCSRPRVRLSDSLSLVSLFGLCALTCILLPPFKYQWKNIIFLAQFIDRLLLEWLLMWEKKGKYELKRNEGEVRADQRIRKLLINIEKIHACRMRSLCPVPPNIFENSNRPKVCMNCVLIYHFRVPKFNNCVILRHSYEF